MTIGVDIRVLARGARTGVEEYTINLLSHLLPLEDKINYRLFYNAWQKASLNYPWLFLSNVKLNDFRIPNRAFFFLARYFNQPKIDSLFGKTDIYFNPHFFVSPVSKKCKKVITFHDLSFEYHPEFFSWRKRLWQKFLMNTKKEAQKADKIITVSQSTKDDLIDLYRIDPEKIKVVYSGVGEQFRPIDDQLKLNLIREKYQLPEKFILYFGTIEPRKNLIGLIKAFEMLRDNRSIGLVISGVKGWLYKDIFRATNQSKYHNDIFFTGFIEEDDKPYLYNLAELFVYPSFFEGFGFPPLEAMACGLPVIVSSGSSLSEVVGQAGLMTDVSSVDELSWTMDMVLSDSHLKDQLIEKGFSQAKKFSWAKCARETLDVLQSTLTGTK